LGRLRQHRLRDPQGALEVFETYRRTYPNGSLLPEVDLAVLEVEVAAGHRDQALAESVRFLASHPASERTVEVHLLRGDLLRERGDYRSALAEYRQVNVATSAPFAEDALFETAYCQRKVGDTAAARESLRQYRQRYPSGAHRDEVAKALRE
jgi:TolA-binding protein